MTQAPTPPETSTSGKDDATQRLTRKEQEEELDEGLQNSFPASDPVSISQPTTAMPTVSQSRLSATGDWVRSEILKAVRRTSMKAGEKRHR